jgi:hypothetical protein
MGREKSNWETISKQLDLIRSNPDQYLKEYDARRDAHILSCAMIPVFCAAAGGL